MPVPSDGQAASHVTGVVAAPVQGGMATVTRRPTPMRARHVKLQAAEGSGIVVTRRPEGREEVMPTPSAGETAGADAGAATTFVDNGGPVLQNIHVHLIFWGSAWAGSTTPSAAAVTNAVSSILSGPYMSGLSQYRGIGNGVLKGTTLATGSNPPNPFSNNDVTTLISDCIEAGALPEPDDDGLLFYCVIMPPGVNTNQAGVIGEHSYFWYTDYDFPFDFDNDKAHYAWVMNNGTLDFVTTVFSHELVETATDPEGSAILGAAGTCSGTGWCEIGDVCSSTGVVDGVTVQSYWSQRDGACIVPTGLPRWTSMRGVINRGLSAIRN